MQETCYNLSGEKSEGVESPPVGPVWAGTSFKYNEELLFLELKAVEAEPQGMGSFLKIQSSNF